MLEHNASRAAVVRNLIQQLVSIHKLFDICRWMFHLTQTQLFNLTPPNPNPNPRMDERKMTTKDAYKYFVLKAQELAIKLNWTPVNWSVPGILVLSFTLQVTTHSGVTREL